jgi:DNA-binding beta-propeller fold protein YncE
VEGISMLAKKLILITALSVASGALVSCDSDDGGDGGTLTGTRIWIADQPDKEVVIYDDEGNRLKYVGGPGLFSKPNAIDVYEKDGSAWVCDFYSNRIRKFDADGEQLYASPEPSMGALVRNPVDLSASQSTGDCWISDRGNNRVIRLDAKGNVLAKVNGFQYPRGVSADPAGGDVWVADEGHDAVIKIASTANGEVIVRSVEIGRYRGMENPWAVAADADGKGWAASRIEGRVVKLSGDAAELASVEGFDDPVAVAVYEAGKAVYVVDTAKGLLVALPRGVSGAHGNYADVATFVVTGLSRPEDVFVDDDTGRIYVAEMGAGNVKVFDSAGKLVNTIPGFSGPAALAAWSEN